MKTKPFQTKRRPKRGGGGFRMLHAKTQKKKQRVAAAAASGDFTSEEPNLGVARALVVILVLHVAAIIAIMLHNHATKSDGAIAETPKVEANQDTATVAAATEAPKVSGEWYWVKPGDTYERIARKHNVDVNLLRRLNIPRGKSEPVALRPNLALNLPEESNTVAPVVEQPVQPAAVSMAQLPPIQYSQQTHSMPAEYEVVSQPEPVAARQVPTVAQLPQPQPTQVAEPVSAELTPLPPAIERKPAPQPQPQVQVQPKPEPEPVVEMQVYTVRKGDTVWAIAKRNGVSQQQLMSANKSFDPRKMRVGMKLNIPTN